jgi:peptide/nickel transport system substrate-binding protein
MTALQRQSCTAFLAITFLLAATTYAYQESPNTSKLVDEGVLPPVTERLPEDPLLVQPVYRVGQYGGTWRRAYVNLSDIALNNRMGYEPLVRWDRTGQRVVPNIATSWEIRDEGRTFVFTLRKGIRWSDGHPLTTEDLRFWYEDMTCNTEISPVFPGWLLSGGEKMELEISDPYTFALKFKEPNGIFLEMLAFRGTEVFSPKHYLSQFHDKYADPEKLQHLMEENGADFWYQLFGRKGGVNALCENPDLPTLNPWKIHVPPPATRAIAIRNPYYWKVDPAGNQLPYIEEVAYALTANRDLINFKALAGEIDFQARNIDAKNYPLFMENRAKGGFRVYRDYDPLSTVIYVNQTAKDPAVRALLQERRFRIALSHAINRDEIVDLIYNSLAVPSRGVVSKYDPYYEPYFDETYIDYNPARANELLDELGMKHDASGLRTMPNGDPFFQVLHCYPSELGTGAEQWQLVADYWREVGLNFVIKFDRANLSVLRVSQGNSDFWAYATAGMHWIIDPLWYVPWSNRSYFAPLYGLYYSSEGKAGEQPPPTIQQLLDWYLELRGVVNDDARRRELAHRILNQWVEECYTIGIVHQNQLTIVSDRFKNVPDEIIHSFRLMTPGYIGVEQFYIEQE